MPGIELKVRPGILFPEVCKLFPHCAERNWCRRLESTVVPIAATRLLQMSQRLT
jgi:hypothetical protein